MRRKSARNAQKATPDKAVKETETPPKTRRSRRRKRSPSKSSDSEEEVLTVTKRTALEETPDTTTKSHTPTDEEGAEEPMWKVTSSEEAPKGEIQKLKLCLTRPPPDSPDKSKSRRSKSNSQTEDDATSSEDKSSRRTRSRGSPYVRNDGLSSQEGDEDVEEKKGKGKSKGKHKSKIEKSPQLSEPEIQPKNDISENVQVTPQSPSIDKPVDNENDYKVNVNETVQNIAEEDSRNDKEHHDKDEAKNKESDDEPLSVIQKNATEDKQKEETTEEHEIATSEKENQQSEESPTETNVSEQSQPQAQVAADKGEDKIVEEPAVTPDHELTPEASESKEVEAEVKTLIEETETSKAITHTQDKAPVETKNEEMKEDSLMQVAEVNQPNTEEVEEREKTPEKSSEETTLPLKTLEKSSKVFTSSSKTLERRSQEPILPLKTQERSSEETASPSKSPEKMSKEATSPSKTLEKSSKELTSSSKTLERRSQEPILPPKTQERSCKETTSPSKSPEKMSKEATSPSKTLEKSSEEITSSSKTLERRSQEPILHSKTQEKSSKETVSPSKSPEKRSKESTLPLKTLEKSSKEITSSSKTLEKRSKETISPSNTPEKSSKETIPLSKSIKETTPPPKTTKAKRQNEPERKRTPRRRLIRNNEYNQPEYKEQEDSTEPSQIKPSTLKRKWEGSLNLSPAFTKIDLEGMQEVFPTIDFPEEPDLHLEVEKERRKSVTEPSAKKIERKVSIEYTTERPSFESQNSTSSVTQESEDNSNIIAFNRKISIVDDTASKLKPPPSPSKNPVSSILFITNLVRPFTVKQLKELLERTGKVVEDGFWTDRIKSKCYVQYETQEEAEATRNALHGVQWPIGNGKKLIIDYASGEDMEKAKNPPPPVATPTPTPEIKVAAKENLEPSENKIREEKVTKEVEKKRDGPVREWDIGKKDVRRERSRSRERNRKHRRSPSPHDDFISRKQRKTEESVPQKLMDDLFLKTKATPSIYWQPLSPEEISMKQQQRLIRMEEHKRRMEENSRMKGRDMGRGAFRRRYD